MAAATPATADGDTPFYRRLSLQIDGFQAALISTGGGVNANADVIIDDEPRSEAISTPVAIKQQPPTPIANLPKNRHASARIGTVFGGGGDLTAFKREWTKAQVVSDEDVEEEEQEATPAVQHDATDDEVEDTQPQSDTEQVSEGDDWDSSFGIRSAMATCYSTQTYATVDEDLFGWEGGGGGGGGGYGQPSSNITPPRAGANTHKQGQHHLLPAMLRSQARLDGEARLDIQRSASAASLPIAGSASSQRLRSPASPVKSIPAPLLRPAQLAELERRTAAEQQTTQTTPAADAPMTWQLPEEKESTASPSSSAQGRALSHAASMPSLALSTHQFVVPPSTAGLAYLDAAFQQPPAVLSPRSRYDQLVRACEQILPPVASPTTHPNTSRVPPMTQRLQLDRQTSNHSSNASSRALTRRPRVSGGASPNPSTFGHHLRGQPSTDFGLLAARLARQSEEGSELMRVLKRRKKLRSEFLREIERPTRLEQDDKLSRDTRPGLAVLSSQENSRIATYRTKAAALLTISSGSAASDNGGHAVYSSAAILAAQETRGPDVAAPPAALAAARLRSTKDPSPSASKGHTYMRTHALHHHLKMPQEPKANMAHVFATVPLASDPVFVEPPLPSKSRALQLQSPSSHVGWSPPSQSCMSLSEQIYKSTRALGGLISSGEGRELMDRHLNMIRPSHLLDESRQKALAAAAIERMQLIAAEHKARVLKAKLESGASIARARTEARQRKRQEKADREHEADQRLKEDLEAAVQKMALEEAAALVAQNQRPSGLTVGIIEGAVLEEGGELTEGETDVEEPTSPTSPLQPQSPLLVSFSEPTSPNPAPLSPPAVASIPALAPAAAPAPAPAQTSPLARLRTHVRNSSSLASITSQFDFAAKQKQVAAESSSSTAPTRTASASSSWHPRQLLSAPVRSYSVHRVPRSASRGSSFGPCGEDLSRVGVIPPASYAAGHMLDVSVSASDERRTEDERVASQKADITAVMARLYQRVTPQEKRLRRLDQPKATQDDLRRVVEETLGEHDPRAKKRFH